MPMSVRFRNASAGRPTAACDACSARLPRLPCSGGMATGRTAWERPTRTACRCAQVVSCHAALTTDGGLTSGSSFDLVKDPHDLAVEQEIVQCEERNEGHAEEIQ